MNSLINKHYLCSSKLSDRMTKKLKNYFRLIRTPQWIKNFFIFLPLFFSFRIDEPNLWIADIWAFIGFCFVASAVYIINDWNDIKSDSLHPEKKNRPLASGAVNKKEALILILGLFTIGELIYILVLKNYTATYLISAYFILNIFYSIKLKHIPIVDISIVAIGFVIRVFIGGIVTGIPLTKWLVIMTFLMAIFFVLGKRRDDMVIFEKTGKKARKNLDGYNLEFLNATIIIVSTIMMVSYIMYTLSADVAVRNGENLYLTSLFVFMGLFRYLQIIFIEEKSGSPTKVFLKDHFIHIIVFCWLISFYVISKYFR